MNKVDELNPDPWDARSLKEKEIKFLSFHSTASLGNFEEAVAGEKNEKIGGKKKYNALFSNDADHFKVRGSDIDKWNKIDDEIWTHRIPQMSTWSFWLNATIKTSSNKCKIQCHLEQRD